MAWHDVCALGDIPTGRGWPVRVEGVAVAVFNQAGTLFALANECLHLGSPLDDGTVIHGCLICPWHGWRYDLATGDHLTAVGPRPGLATYPVRNEGGRVLIQI